MSDFAAWLIGLVKDIIKAFWDLVTDIIINVLELLLNAVVAVLGALPEPCCLDTGSLQVLFNAIPPDALYFTSKLMLSQCFAILACGVIFRLARKAITLFQW